MSQARQRSERGLSISIPPGKPTRSAWSWIKGRIAAIRLFDPLSQRGTCDSGPIRLLPASEAFTVPGETEIDQSAQAAERLLPHRSTKGISASACCSFIAFA